MSKDTDNAHIYDLGEVWVAESLDTSNPDHDEDFGEGWTEVGLMDGDDGFTTSRDEDKNKHYGWGGILIRESRQKFTLTRKFTALEDNKTTRELIWPGSTASKIVQPKPKPVKLAFVKYDGDYTVREFTSKHAIVDIDGDINENEPDLTKYELTADIYPKVDGDENRYFDVQKIDADGELIEDEGGGQSGEG